jgi:uncharacterized membrane protein YhaH (DUF805 family)
MNPFTKDLSRLGFLLWSILLIIYVVGFGVLIDRTKAHHVGVYWLPLRVVWGVILIVISLLVVYRRLQNAGLSRWLILVSLIPYIGELLWLALFFIPPKPVKKVKQTNV